VTAVILLQQPVEKLEACLLADRPPGTDLGGMVAYLRVEVRPPIGPASK
jgi:hypothetical protein